MLEQELKLTAPDRGTLEAVLDYQEVKSAAESWQVFHPDLAHSTEPQQFHAIYYDTADRQLVDKKYSLRIRQEGESLRAAFKLPGQITDGLSSREEYQADASKWLTMVSDLPDSPLKQTVIGLLPLDAALIPIVTVMMERTIRMLRIEQSEIELVTDTGEIKGLRQAVEHHEVELELKSASLDPLLVPGKMLEREFDLVRSTRTKHGIGLGLC